jgi:hypothetical protein
MTLLILDATVLSNKDFGVEVDDLPALEVSDERDSYDRTDGDGLWIGVYLGFLAEQGRLLGLEKDFFFSDESTLDEETFEEVPSLFARRLMVEFTNQHYEDWKAQAITLPDWDDIREQNRDFCDECEAGWERVPGTYNGPWAEDVEDDEDVSEPKLGEAEVAARRERNQEREAERRRRESAQEEAEAEEVERNFICDDDCNSFCERVEEQFLEAIEIEAASLKSAWEKFSAEKCTRNLPPL